jgi:hypothetical protein
MPERPEPSVAAVLAALAAGAAAIHLAMVPMHAEEWLALGIGFAAVGWAQAALAVAVVTRPRRWLLAAGAVLSVGAIAAWTVSRTTGFPFGPEAGQAEPASAIDVLSVVFEALFAVGAVAALRARPVTRRRPLAAGIAAVATLSVAALSSAVLASPSGAHDHVAGEAAEEGHTHAGEVAAADDHAHEHAAPAPADGEQASAADEIAADETSAGHEHGHGSVPNVPIDAATRATLASQLVQARAVADRFPTVADAEAAGYTMVTPYVPLIGAHYIKWSLMDGTFDVAQPEMLLYDGTAPTSAMVGLSYYQFSRTEPSGFAGPNDHWHQHIGLCLNSQLVVVGGSSTSAEECAARGGQKIEASDGWMVHAWVVPGWESQEGVFSPENADLR